MEMFLHTGTRPVWEWGFLVWVLQSQLHFNIMLIVFE
jgi:hypothetical protein